MEFDVSCEAAEDLASSIIHCLAVNNRLQDGETCKVHLDKKYSCTYHKNQPCEFLIKIKGDSWILFHIADCTCQNCRIKFSPRKKDRGVYQINRQLKLKRKVCCLPQKILGNGRNSIRFLRINLNRTNIQEGEVHKTQDFRLIQFNESISKRCRMTEPSNPETDLIEPQSLAGNQMHSNEISSCSCMDSRGEAKASLISEAGVTLNSNGSEHNETEEGSTITHITSKQSPDATNIYSPDDESVKTLNADEVIFFVGDVLLDIDKY